MKHLIILSSLSLSAVAMAAFAPSAKVSFADLEPAKPRSAVLVGSAIEVPVTDESVKDAAAFAVNAHKKPGLLGSDVKLVEILSAKKQIVAGVLYQLKILVKVGNGVRAADVVVLDQAWAPPAYLLEWKWSK